MRYGFNPGRWACRMHSVQKVSALSWKEFHAALMLSYRNLGDAERSASTRHDRFVLDSLFALQNAVGRMAGVSNKDLASEAEWLGRSWAWMRHRACLGLHSHRDVIR